jgi:branched-chain amino acid transport system permease protein
MPARILPGLGILAALAVACALPLLVGGQPYLLHLATLALCYAVPAMGLNLLFGYTGLVSLGQMGFAGVGAYTAALMLKSGIPFLPALVAAAAAGGLAGLLVGLPCLRLRSHFFIIVTLAFGVILYALFNNLDWLTGGAEGLPGIPRPRPLDLGFTVLDFRRPLGFYWLALVVFLAMFLLQAAIVHSDFGRNLSAIRQDEPLAAARGVNVFANKLAIFAISAAMAGIGGAMKVVLLRAAAPLSFDLSESINLVLIVILGGAGYLLGPLLGAILYVGLPELLRAAAEMRLVIFGLLLVLLALFAPRGASGLLHTAVTALGRKTGNGLTKEAPRAGHS